MHIGIVGINHKSASLELREVLARGFERAFVREEGVLLSTCNRTEYYFSARGLAEAQIDVLSQLRGYVNAPFEHALYSYFGKDCFTHFGRVVSGIDSAIFGESEIQRQAKLAYETARKAQKLPHDLHYLFQKGLKIGKEMRTSFLLSQKEISLPFAIQFLIERNQLSLDQSKILFVGNSAINRKLISFFRRHGASDLTLCTRMKGEFGIQTVGWEKLNEWNVYDVVICGTHHDEYVVRPLQETSKTLLFDLSVPRMVDPRLPNLYNIDQISEIAQKKRGEKEIVLCETVIEKVVTKQMTLFKERKMAKWRYATAL